MPIERGPECSCYRFSYWRGPDWFVSRLRHPIEENVGYHNQGEKHKGADEVKPLNAKMTSDSEEERKGSFSLELCGSFFEDGFDAFL